MNFPNYLWAICGPLVPKPLPAPNLTPKCVVLPLATASTSTVVPPITYQTLEGLLADLNALLWTPHDGHPFEFRGTWSVVSDPDAADTALLHTARVSRVARQLIGARR
jgi:hypothetical protein